MIAEPNRPWVVPGSWEWTTFGEVTRVIGGGTPSTTDAANWTSGSIPWITPADLSGHSRKQISRGSRNITAHGLQHSGARVLPTGTVLFSSRAPIGYVVVAANPLATNQGFKSFVLPGSLAPDYVYYYLQRAREIALSLASGTTFLELSGTKAALIPLPIAPLAEQRRIVEEVEKQLTRLDAAVAALKRVQAQLKRYRASVLKAACEGRLVPTEAELARREGRTYEPNAPFPSAEALTHSGAKRAGRLWGAGVVPALTESEKAVLPVGWVWMKVRDLGPAPDDVVQVGPMSMRSEDFGTEGVPVLNVGCVQWGRFDEGKLDHLPSDKAGAFGRYRVQAGDVLFTRSGTMGRCAVAKPHQSGWLMTFHLLRARVHSQRCLPEYLRLVFEGARHIRRQTREASVGTTRAGFNTNLLARLDVPLPPVSEQNRIIAEVERLLSIAEEPGGAVRCQLTRAAALRQAILRTAFSGKLVPQDPNDEPASVLLERIRAERAAAASAPQARPPRRRRRSSGTARAADGAATPQSSRRGQRPGSGRRGAGD